jgi:hypothetical protein
LFVIGQESAFAVALAFVLASTFAVAYSLLSTLVSVLLSEDVCAFANIAVEGPAPLPAFFIPSGIREPPLPMRRRKPYSRGQTFSLHGEKHCSQLRIIAKSSKN